MIANDPDVDYFDVRDEDGRILLIPMRPNRADRVRGKLEQVGISDQDVDAAVRWARGVDSGTGEDGYGLLRCERPGNDGSRTSMPLALVGNKGVMYPDGASDG